MFNRKRYHKMARSWESPPAVPLLSLTPKVHYSLAPPHTPRQSTVRLLLHPQLPWDTTWAQHASLPDTSITKALSSVRKPQLLQQPTQSILVSGLHTASSETIATSAPILYLHRWRSLPCSGPGPTKPSSHPKATSYLLFNHWSYVMYLV